MKTNWQLKLGATLVILSAAFYCLHYLIFRDLHHIMIYLVGDIAFVFLEVLMVTLIIHELLSRRERRQRLEKLNMVIGAFFSEVGTELLKVLSDWDPNLENVRTRLQVTTLWTEEQFDSVEQSMKGYKFHVAQERLKPLTLRAFLATKLEFLLRLMENPNVLEHETFTGLLLAVFHLSEELVAREDLTELPATDLGHLAGDANRVYGQLTERWLDYMKYLRTNYPYLFSLAVRTNPFDKTASPVVT
jgi:hypothetical protein